MWKKYSFLGIVGSQLGGGKFQSFDELIQTLTSIIFMCIGGHAAVNLPQYDEYGYPPNYPTLLLGEPSCNTVSKQSQKWSKLR